jgi:hypothetical protein
MSDATTSQNYGKVAIPRLERAPPPPRPLTKATSTEKKQEDRVYVVHYMPSHLQTLIIAR